MNVITPQELVIVGAGGAASEALWVCARMKAAGLGDWKVLGFTDDNPDRTGQPFDGLQILGTSVQIAQRFGGRGVHFHCAIGHNRARQRISLALEAAGLIAVSLIDPSAIVAPTASVGPGTYIGPLSIVAPYAKVGRHVLVNSNVGVGHHAQVGDFAQLCPGVRVNGGCSIECGAFLGSNATVHPKLSVGEGASVGANSFVIRSVKARHSVLGVPAKIISRPPQEGPTL